MSVRDLKGGLPPLRARRMTLARVKENFCSISRRGMVCFVLFCFVWGREGWVVLVLRCLLRLLVLMIVVSEGLERNWILGCRTEKRK